MIHLLKTGVTHIGNDKKRQALCYHEFMNSIILGFLETYLLARMGDHSLVRVENLLDHGHSSAHHCFCIDF